MKTPNRLIAGALMTLLLMGVTGCSGFYGIRAVRLQASPHDKDSETVRLTVTPDEIHKAREIVDAIAVKSGWHHAKVASFEYFDPKHPKKTLPLAEAWITTDPEGNYFELFVVQEWQVGREGRRFLQTVKEALVAEFGPERVLGPENLWF